MLLQHLLATVLLFSHNADNVVFGAVHTFFTSGFVSPIIYALQFNDHEKQVKLLHKINGSGGHPWIAFSSDKKVLYGGAPGGWSSYKINSDYSLTHGRSVKLQGVCVSSSTSSRGTTWVVADPRPPHFVYGSPFTNCANVISINQNGLLDSVVQNITYPRASGIHGMAFDPEGTMLYSADTKAHGIWAHAIDRPSGLLRNISFTPLPGTGPRHVTAHPNGRWLYAVCE
jgi:carboxy-cis,cis-muconate cyclase